MVQDIQICRYCNGKIKGKERYSKKEAFFYRALGGLSHGECSTHFANRNMARNLANKLILGASFILLAASITWAYPTLFSNVAFDSVNSMMNMFPMLAFALAIFGFIFAFGAWSEGQLLKQKREAIGSNGD